MFLDYTHILFEHTPDKISQAGSDLVKEGTTPRDMTMTWYYHPIREGVIQPVSYHLYQNEIPAL